MYACWQREIYQEEGEPIWLIADQILIDFFKYNLDHSIDISDKAALPGLTRISWMVLEELIFFIFPYIFTDCLT